MSWLDTRPVALFGGPLAGDCALRYVFVDEAGTSAKEPVTVVVGIIAHADVHLVAAEALLTETLGAVPHKYREGFVFHATDVWNSPVHRDEWLQSDRLSFLCDVMRIPRRLGMAVSFGMYRRNSPDVAGVESTGMSQVQFQHFSAFGHCLQMADRYVRDYGEPREVATVVAEDEKDMRKHLRQIPIHFRDLARNLGKKEMLSPTVEEQKIGYLKQETDLRISRIRKSIHFVAKDEDPMVQIADACAFGLRRYFSEGEHGDAFINAMLGGIPNRADYAGGSNYGTFFWHPTKWMQQQPAFILR